MDSVVEEDLYNIDFDDTLTYDEWITDENLDSSCGLELAPQVSEDEANEMHRAKPVQQNPKISPVFRKPHELGCLKNSRQGKTLEGYMARQIRIARKICKQCIKLYNSHDVNEFNSFAEQHYTEDFVYHDRSKRKVHPLTGTAGVEITTVGLTEFKKFCEQLFAAIPDGVVVVDSIQIMHQGKKVSMRMTFYGTVVKNVEFRGRDEPFNIPVAKSNKTTTSSTPIESHADNPNIEAVLRKAHARRVCMQFLLNDDNKVYRLENFSV